MSDPVRAASPPAVGDASFDAYYYAHCCGDPYQRTDALLRFFGGIADRIVADIAPATVLDAGCAIGLLVETLRERGVDASGIDLSSYAIGQAHETVRAHCRHGSIADEFPARYDLIVSIEVLEHMPAREAEAAIANFCRHTDDVVFSSSPSDYKEPTHVNVHPPEYWASEFARYGFYRDVDFDGSNITPWAVRFRRSGEPFHRVVRGYERRFWELTLERNDTRQYSMDIQGRLVHATKAMTEARLQADAARAEMEVVRRQAVETERRFAELQVETERRFTEREVETHRRLAGREADVGRLDIEIAQARDRIFHMERSVFWRARNLWQRLRGGS